MNIILLGYPNRAGIEMIAQELTPEIRKVANIVCSDFTGEKNLSHYKADAVVVLGGDGSIFRAVNQMGEKQRPLIAVNLGRLGFLADVALEELVPLLKLFDGKPLPVVPLMMYQCRILRNGKAIKTVQGVNEAAILNGAPFDIMEIKLYADRTDTATRRSLADVSAPFDQRFELVTTYSCDGLIVSTPVGSTAHNLSAGGPILHKTMQAFVVCPISAHTLTNRPVVDNANRVFVMEIVNPNPETSVVVDGQILDRLEPGDQVEIRKSHLSVQLVASPHKSYYQTLREKLGWSGQPIYRVRN